MGDVDERPFYVWGKRRRRTKPSERRRNADQLGEGAAGLGGELYQQQGVRSGLEDSETSLISESDMEEAGFEISSPLQQNQGFDSPPHEHSEEEEPP